MPHTDFTRILATARAGKSGKKAARVAKLVVVAAGKVLSVSRRQRLQRSRYALGFNPAAIKQIPRHENNVRLQLHRARHNLSAKPQLVDMPQVHVAQHQRRAPLPRRWQAG